MLYIHVIYNVSLDTRGNTEERKDWTKEVCPQNLHLILQLERFLCATIVNELEAGKSLWICDYMYLWNTHMCLNRECTVYSLHSYSNSLQGMDMFPYQLDYFSLSSNDVNNLCPK